MRSNPRQVLKVICLVLAAVVLFQIVRIVLGANPLARVTIPALPTLAEETPPASQNKGSSGEPGRPLARSPATLSPEPGEREGASSGTGEVSEVLVSTNGVNKELENAAKTNLTLASTNGSASNAAVRTETNSGPPSPQALAKTNTLVSRDSPNEHAPTNHSPRMPMIHMANAARPMRAGNQTPLPPAIQARIDRITDSEILGPVMHPLPMALLGIAGDSRFCVRRMRQTGLVKEGDSTGRHQIAAYRHQPRPD